MSIEQSRERDLIDAFVTLATHVPAEFDLVEEMQLIVRQADHLVAADAVGALVQGPAGNLQVMATSSERLHHLEVFQLSAAEGPCLEAYERAERVTETDLQSMRERYPVVAAGFQMAGFQSVTAVPIALGGQCLGVLVLVYKNPCAPIEADVYLAEALAAVAAAGILWNRDRVEAQRKSEQLQEALHSRVTLDMARGFLSGVGGLRHEEAFEAMRRYARRNHTKLTSVASRLLDRRLDPQEVLGKAGAAAG